MVTQTVFLNPKASLLAAPSCKIAILGFGTVGSSVARILGNEKGHGLALVQIFNRNVERKRAAWVDASVLWTQDFEDVLESDADVVVEVMGGIEPARQWITALLGSGKSV